MDGSKPKCACCQSHSARSNSRPARQQDQQPQMRPFSSVKTLKTPRQLRVFRQQPLADGKHLREKGKGNQLKAHDDRHAGHHQRADVQPDAADFDIMQGQAPPRRRNPAAESSKSRHRETASAANK